jgi:eukaryotic-like serine/threonine-protein kinase
VTGETLTEVIKKGAMGPRRAIFVARQILAGLEHAHTLRVVHRDIKPDNVFITQVAGFEDFVRILDFGLAKIIGLDTAPILTGTPAYMSPEQTHTQDVDARSDVYTVGLLLFEMLTETRACKAETLPEMLKLHRVTPMPLIRSVRPELGFSPELEAVVETALRKPPSERYQTAADFRTALSSVPEAKEPVPPKAQFSTVTWILLAATALFGLLSLILLFKLLGR